MSSIAGKAALDALRNVTSRFEGAEERQGQMEMSHAIAESLASGRSIIVQAGTGTGKSLGYLIPAVLHGKKAVVATATKALQDQLARNDLPLLQETIGVDFTWAVVKGRSNYVCRQRIEELESKDDQIEFDEMRDSVKKEVDELVKWARTTDSGDFEDLPRLPSDRAKPRAQQMSTRFFLFRRNCSRSCANSRRDRREYPSLRQSHRERRKHLA
jgi:ATP-dependent DNA helicase DinG